MQKKLSIIYLLTHSKTAKTFVFFFFFLTGIKHFAANKLRSLNQAFTEPSTKPQSINPSLELGQQLSQS